ncbi:MAG: sigma-70 family RNA polymerase sigma factor [Firmicutes bacterium]|nr:sigma-70 family RNA polymerase sigma factor [Bacillota bacterium]
MSSPKTNPVLVRTPAGGADEHRFVERARQGDLAAFEELVNRYEQKIFRLAMNITGNREDAEDVLQEAFLKAYTNLGRFQGDSRFYTWLVRIAINEGLMKLRKRRANVVSLDQEVETDEDVLPRQVEDWGPNPEQRFAQIELQHILDEAIASLEPGYRIVFVLRDIEQLSSEEIAQVLGLSVPAVKSRLLRARLKLRERLNPYFRPGESPLPARPER